MSISNTPVPEALPPSVAATPKLPLRKSESGGALPPTSPPSGRSTSRAPPARIPYRPSRRSHDAPGISPDFDVPVSSASFRSTRPMREEWDDDYAYRESESDRDYYREEWRHPDAYTRRHPSVRGRRPPRSYMNRPYHQEDLDGGPGPFSPSQPYFDHSPRSQRSRDIEMGFGHAGTADSGPKVDWKNLSKEEKGEILRIPLTQWMNSNFKNHFVATIGEFIGTTMFLLFAFAGTEVANIQSDAGSSSADSNSTTGAATGFNVAVLLYISLIFGFSLMVNVWIFFRISGGLFNPAVTFGMLLVGAVSLTRALCLFVAQIAGSLLASVVVRFLLPENFNVRTTLTGGATVAQGVILEAILTAELVFTIFMLAKEKHRATFIAPVGIGLALFIGELVGVQFTGGSLNPARSFGPCVITLTFDEEHWIYWVGPLVGALIAVAFYRFIKMLEYEMANPGADGDPLNDPTQNPEKMAELKNKKDMPKDMPSLQNYQSADGSVV
ncbi:Uu.00g068230.m01.CDS01 [Anthostomella pinea]|uniref:Uu.00g068230.m01.CDS01 n=1 Tax=Anthostomella pinea TaxID=933095 RepID=A0AAI8VUA5_9PEZI|nr:Uu.00g068230.m01.CDS01 [Anthostomella pinea]